jgi:hypothetical protein
MADGKIKINQGKVLIAASGKVARAVACCCGCPCADDQPTCDVTVSPDDASNCVNWCQGHYLFELFLPGSICIWIMYGTYSEVWIGYDPITGAWSICIPGMFGDGTGDIPTVNPSSDVTGILSCLNGKLVASEPMVLPGIVGNLCEGYTTATITLR